MPNGIRHARHVTQHVPTGAYWPVANTAHQRRYRKAIRGVFYTTFNLFSVSSLFWL